MKTDDLIAVLARDAVPGPPVAARVWRAVPLALALVVGLVALVLGLRADLGQVPANPLWLARMALAAALVLTAGIATLRLARPDARPRLWPPALVALAGAVLWLASFAATPPALRGAAITGETLAFCLTAIPALAVLTTGAILWALRQGAPLRPGLTGFMAGLTGGALAAAAYALHCTEDDPLFFVTWYGTGILIAGLGGSIAGRRVLRW